MSTLQSNIGLNWISTTTVGNAVTSAPVTGCFSSLYNNYKITYEGGVASGSAGLGLILGATATGYSYAAMYQQYNATTPLGVGAVATTAFLNAGRGTTTGNSMEIELYRPFLSATTGARWGSTDYLAASGFVLTGGGVLDNTTSYTGFSITCSGITMTGGTITVYGYRK